MHKQYYLNYGPMSVLSCFIKQCVYIRFACRSECDHSNPALRAETLVVHCQEDDRLYPINKSYMSWTSGLTVDLPFRILPTSPRNNRRSLSLYSGGMRHLKIIPLTCQSRKNFVKTFCSKFFKNFPELTCNSGKIKLR